MRKSIARKSREGLHELSRKKSERQRCPRCNRLFARLDTHLSATCKDNVSTITEELKFCELKGGNIEKAQTRSGTYVLEAHCQTM